MYPATDVVATLQAAVKKHGLPKRIRVDNGPEFVSKELDFWTYANGVILDFTRPGKPTDRSIIEAFISRFRPEILIAFE